MRFKAELVDYYLANKDVMSLPAIASKVANDENDITLSEGTIYNYLKKIKREQTAVITVDDTTPSWRVQDDKYLFEVNDSVKVFSIEQIDQIFLYYSKTGYNYTRLAVQRRFKIKPKTFNEIQRAFHLSKDCDIISPFTKQSMNHEELGALIDRLQEEIIDSGEMTLIRSQKAIARAHGKIINREKSDINWRDTVISDLLDNVGQWEKVSLKTTTKTSSRYIEMDWNITDIHSGSAATKMKITEDWSIEKLEEKLDRAAQLINSYNCKVNHLNFLGDLVETISGVNHPDSWKLIQDGHFGSAAIIGSFEIILRFLNKVNNITSINGVGGNHDRLQASNKLSDTGATDLVFYMLEQHMKGSGVEINYDPVVLSFERETYNVVLGHGDQGLHKRGIADQMVLFKLNLSKFTFINTGHLHTFLVKDSQYIGRATVNPSIITGNHYSDVQIGKSDRSGITFNATNIFGEPVQTIENI